MVHVISYSTTSNHGVYLSDRQWEFDPIKDIAFLYLLFHRTLPSYSMGSQASTEIRDKKGVRHDPREIRCSKHIFSLIPLNNMKKNVEYVCPRTNNLTAT
jgi:hypothetical protein